MSKQQRDAIDAALRAEPFNRSWPAQEPSPWPPASGPDQADTVNAPAISAQAD